MEGEEREDVYKQGKGWEANGRGEKEATVRKRREKSVM